MQKFYQVLANTTVANVTTSYLWFALTFWLYLETQSVLVTGIVGGSYMLLVAMSSIIFGAFVDHHKKKLAFVVSSVASATAFVVAGIIYFVALRGSHIDATNPIVWALMVIILIGAVVENMRNIALSTTVTLLVDEKNHAHANGLAGAVQGVGFIVTSVLSGLSVGLVGFGWTLMIAIVLTIATLLHVVTIRIPEEHIVHDPELKNKRIDLKGSMKIIHSAPGLLAMIIFSTFNNLIGGVYMALMDPYGLSMFSVTQWGMVFGITGTGFVAGGLVVAKYGLGKNPIRTLLILTIVMGLLGSLFTIREWWWLYVLGIWLYMTMIPAIEAAEQTVIQKVVPYKRQGRVFGFAGAIEAAAAPITAFLIAPIAEFFIIPFMKSDSGTQQFGWLLGSGQARGIALVFFIAGLIMVAAGILAFRTKSYRLLSARYEEE